MNKNLEYLANFLLATLITVLVSILAGIENFFVILGIFLVSYPWKIKGSIFSLFGGSNYTGDVFSLFPLIQVSRGKSVGVISPACFQEARGEASLLIGISFFQNAESSFLWFGVIVDQLAKKNSSITAGIVISQFSGDEAACGIGVVFHQRAENKAYLGFGIPFFQKAKECGVDLKAADEIIAKNEDKH